MNLTTKRIGFGALLAGIAAIALLAANAYAGSLGSPLLVGPGQGDFKVTFTLFTNRNLTQNGPTGVVFHYNGIAYLTEGVKAKVVQVERSRQEEANRTTITITITKLGEAVSDSNGQVSFSLPAGRYILQLEVDTPDGHVIKLRPFYFTVFNDIMQNISLDSQRPHHWHAHSRPNVSGNSGQPGSEGISLPEANFDF